MTQLPSKHIQLIQFFTPFCIAALGILVLYLLLDPNTAAKLFVLMTAYFIPPLGKESIIPIGVAGGMITQPFTNTLLIIPPIHPVIMALSIAFVDIVVALFLVWNYDLAKKIPLVGRFMTKVERIGKRSSTKYSWIKPLRFIGIILFVMVPFQGSGGLVGSILGRLIGMKPWNIVYAISIGSLTGCLLIAYFADAIFTVLVTNLLAGLLLVIIIIIIGLMIYMYRRSPKKQA